jgi:outer membrane protein W
MSRLIATIPPGMDFRKCALLLVLASPSFASDVVAFAGGMGVINAISADATSVTISQGIAASQYKPQIGPGLQLFAGAHFNNWISAQATWVWREADFSIIGTSSAPGQFFVERRSSSQSGAVIDGMMYFRPITSRIRPYLGVGLGFVRFESQRRSVVEQGSAAVLPSSRFSSIRPVLDVPVGIDLFLTKHVAFRYSFSETLRHNDIDDQLRPKGSSALLDFQNMFGIMFQR